MPFTMDFYCHDANNSNMEDPRIEVALNPELSREEESVSPTFDVYSPSNSHSPSTISGITGNTSEDSDSEASSSSCSNSYAESDTDTTCSPVFSTSPECLSRAPFIIWKVARDQGLLTARRSLIPVPVDVVEFFDSMDVKPEVYKLSGAPQVYLGYFADTCALYLIEGNCLTNLTSELRKVKVEFEQQKRTILMAQKRKMDEEELNEFEPMMKQGRFEDQMEEPIW